VNPKRSRIRELKAQIKRSKIEKRLHPSDYGAQVNSEISEIRSEIRRIRADLRRENSDGYRRINNRLSAMRSSYRAGGLNLGQYDFEDDERK